eukprot:COSAG01_NODE_94_length_26962_cov_9.110933_20_plen_83_part_00
MSTSNRAAHSAKHCRQLHVMIVRHAVLCPYRYLQLYMDRQTPCMLDLEKVRPTPPTQVTGGVACAQHAVPLLPEHLVDPQLQ